MKMVLIERWLSEIPKKKVFGNIFKLLKWQTFGLKMISKDGGLGQFDVCLLKFRVLSVEFSKF